MSIFSQRLAEIHSQSCQSQAAAVEMIQRRTRESIAQTSFSGYLRGEKEPTIEAAAAMAKAFNVSLDYLCGHVDDRRPTAQLLDRLHQLSFSPEIEQAARRLAAEVLEEDRERLIADIDSARATYIRWKALARIVGLTDETALRQAIKADMTRPQINSIGQAALKFA